MPRYRNITSKDSLFEGVTLRPQEEKSSIVNYDPIPVGLRKISDFPYYNNIIISEVCTSESRFKIKSGIQRYYVHFHVAKGRATIYLQSKDNKPPLKLYSGAKWNFKYLNRLVDTFIVEPEEGGEVWVIVEQT